MKLLTFLGTGNYKRTLYRWGEREHETELFSEAVYHWMEPDSMLVFLTKEAKEHTNWANLQQRIPAGQSVDIPSGKSEAELWTIFQTLADQLKDGDQVVFDITNAFRSLPVLVLLAIQYVRAVRKVEIRHLLYGAFEAHDGNAAPVFDLTPFLSLLDWISAATTFRQSGDSRDLGALLRAAQQQSYQSGRKEGLPKALQGLGNLLDRLSLALSLSRPEIVHENASGLTRQLERVRAESQVWAKPFSLLLDKTAEAYSGFACDEPLRVECEMISWYIERGHIIQAVTLAREWLVSWACRGLNRDPLAGREDVETAIGRLVYAPDSDQTDGITPLVAALSVLPQANQFRETWRIVGDFRNDLAHCGKRENARKLNTIPTQAQETAQRLRDLLGC